MQVIKKINNNVALCVDADGKELVAFGKGIGFPAIPYELEDLGRIDHTFYNISDEYLAILDDIPAEMMDFSARLVDRICVLLPYGLKPNFLLTLADHLSFCIERQKKGIYVHMPLIYEISSTYPLEVRISEQILEDMKKEFHVQLNSREIYGIVLSIVNSRLDEEPTPDKKGEQEQLDELIEDITQIVESDFAMRIKRDTFTYTRFSSHLQHLFARLRVNEQVRSDNAKMYQKMRKEFPQTDRCVEHISNRIKRQMGGKITDEEKFYLMLHVNRVCDNKST